MYLFLEYDREISFSFKKLEVIVCSVSKAAPHSKIFNVFITENNYCHLMKETSRKFHMDNFPLGKTPWIAPQLYLNYLVQSFPTNPFTEALLSLCPHKSTLSINDKIEGEVVESQSNVCIFSWIFYMAIVHFLSLGKSQNNKLLLMISLFHFLITFVAFWHSNWSPYSWSIFSL